MSKYPVDNEMFHILNRIKRDPPRCAVCIHCNKVLEYDDDDEREIVWGRMKRHEIACPKNPLKIALVRLCSAVQVTSEIVPGSSLEAAYGAAQDLLWSVGDQE